MHSYAKIDLHRRIIHLVMGQSKLWFDSSDNGYVNTK